MKNLTSIFLVTLLSFTFGSALAHAGGSKALDPYVGEYVSSGDANCAYNLDVEKWDLKNGHVVRFGTLQGKIPTDAFRKEGHIECKQQGNANDKICTKVLATIVEKQDKKGNDLPPKITLSEAKYFIKNGNEKRGRVIEKLSPKMILEDKKGKIHFTSIQEKVKVKCVYSKVQEGQKPEQLSAKVNHMNRNVKKPIANLEKQDVNRIPAMIPEIAPVTEIPAFNPTEEAK